MSSVRGDLDAVRVAPQPLEAVEDARLGREHVDDEIEVVEQNPFGAVVAFDVRRLDPLVGERFHHAVRDRAHLPRVRAGRDQEEIGEAGGFPQVEHRKIDRLLVFRRANRPIDL